MSIETIFLLAFAASLTALFAWGFRTLPREGWQFLACSATRRNPEGAGVVVLICPPELASPAPNLAQGLSSVASAGAIVLLEVLFAPVFWKMGRSTQTGSRISFHVHPDRI